MKTRAGASTTWRSSGTAEVLITARPRLPRSSFRPPVAEKGSAAVRTTSVSPLAAGKALDTARKEAGKAKDAANKLGAKAEDALAALDSAAAAA